MTLQITARSAPSRAPGAPMSHLCIAGDHDHVCFGVVCRCANHAKARATVTRQPETALSDPITARSLAKPKMRDIWCPSGGPNYPASVSQSATLWITARSGAFRRRREGLCVVRSAFPDLTARNVLGCWSSGALRRDNSKKRAFKGEWQARWGKQHERLGHERQESADGQA